MIQINVNKQKKKIAKNKAGVGNLISKLVGASNEVHNNYNSIYSNNNLQEIMNASKIRRDKKNRSLQMHEDR